MAKDSLLVAVHGVVMGVFVPLLVGRQAGPGVMKPGECVRGLLAALRGRMGRCYPELPLYFMQPDPCQHGSPSRWPQPIS